MSEDLEDYEKHHVDCDYRNSFLAHEVDPEEEIYDCNLNCLNN